MSEETRDIATKQGGAVATLDFVSDSGMGLENVDKQDLALPFLKLLQSGSDETKKKHAKYVEGAEAGMFYNTVTKKLYNGEKGIEVIKNIPGVGRNLQDHLETYIQQECNTSDTLYKYINKFNMIKAGIQWFLNKSGPCSTSFLEAGGFCKSSPDKEYPNIQFHFFPSFVIDHGKVDPDAHGYQLHASLNQPKSRGNIELNTSNPYDHPKIQFNYLEDEYDLNETVKCIHVAREILKQNSMKPYAGKEIGPGYHAQNEEEIKEYIRSKAETAYHPSCTLKMGVDDMAVVNEKLKVNGLQNLRVADASVMPEITSGNLNAPTLMIAERAADFILN